LKILNLYAGIGGNRKLWSDVEVTSIEISQNLADIYQDLFPEDKVIVADAHNYLLEHFAEYDFIWTSPPCPSHSRFRKNIACGTGERKAPPVYPDMKLYAEIIFLEHYFKGKYVVENVMAYYEPLIKPQTIDRHWFWSNFPIMRKKPAEITHFSAFKDVWRENRKRPSTKTYGGNNVERLAKVYGFDLSKYQFKDVRKQQAIRNCVDPVVAKHILDSAFMKPMDVFLKC